MTLDPTPLPSPEPPPESPADALPPGDGAAPQAALTELDDPGRQDSPVRVAEVRLQGGISPTVGFVGGALLAVVGIGCLVLAVSGLVKSSASIAAASPPPPSVALAVPSVVTPADLSHGRSLGLETAPVKVEVWEDFQCPVCARWNATVKEQLLTTYIRPGKAQLAFRDFIVIGRESVVAAVAARIADREGKFWPFVDQLFANQLGENVGSFAPSRLIAMAAVLHIDWQRFQTALLNESEDPAVIKVLQDNQDEGAKLGITGTPSVVVNGTLLAKNDWATVSAAIDKALAGK